MTMRSCKSSPVQFSQDEFIETFGKRPPVVQQENTENAEIAKMRGPRGHQKRHSMFVRPTDIEGIIYKEISYQNRRKKLVQERNCKSKFEDLNNNTTTLKALEENISGLSEKLKTLEMAGEDIDDKGPSPAYKRLRRLSIRKLACRPRRNSEVKPIKRPTTLVRTFSNDDLSTLQENEEEGKVSTPTNTRPTALPGWLASLTPRFERKNIIVPQLSPETPEEEHLPISKANTATYKGYLNRITDKKIGQRFWCVLQDSCIYFYNDINSEFADDVIALGGYHVMNETSRLIASSKPQRFILKRQGSKCYQFSCDSIQETNRWIEHLRNETATTRNLTKATLSRSKSAREFSQQEVMVPGSRLQRSKSDLEKEKVDIEKAKLLHEILTQQAKILREQKELQEMALRRNQNKIPLGKSYSLGMMYSHSDDFGYFSSYDTDSDVASLSSGSRGSSPEGGSSPRSLSTASGESTNSLCSIPEERKSSMAEVNPEILAEIEEFEAFTKRELSRSRSNNV